MPKPPRKASRRGRFQPEIVSAAEARALKAGAGKRGRDKSSASGKPRAGTVKSAEKRAGEQPSKTYSGSKAATRSRAVRDSASLQPKPGQAAKRARPRTSARHAGPVVNEPTRIAKAMARAGLCSRRDAERWIAEGRVRVNGKIIETPAIEIGPTDRVLVDGQPLPAAEPPRLWRLHKPKGCVTTHRDPQGRPTVFDQLPEDLPRVVSIGRLDYNTEGLLLLTNDGALARHLELPETGWLRRYRVRAKGRITQDQLDTLKKGIEIEGIRYREIEATLDSVQGANAWLTIGLREGKNREVRRVLSHLGLEVNRLIRISFGPFQLLDLEPGTVEHVRRKVLADQLGPKLARTFALTDEETEDTDTKGTPQNARRPQRRPARPPRHPSKT